MNTYADRPDGPVAPLQYATALPRRRRRGTFVRVALTIIVLLIAIVPWLIPRVVGFGRCLVVDERDADGLTTVLTFHADGIRQERLGPVMFDITWTPQPFRRDLLDGMELLAGAIVSYEIFPWSRWFVIWGLLLLLGWLNPILRLARKRD